MQCESRGGTRRYDRDAPRRAAIPVHIFHGSQDPWVTTADIDVQTRTIPRSSLVVWADSGHLGFVKHWGEILGTVTRSEDA